ncbi:putative sorbitol/xylitol dehydrogenase, partial [Halenospora varia]
NETFVLHAKGQFLYADRPVPKLPSPRHVLIRVMATGLCGSDVRMSSYWQHGQIGQFVVRQPLVLGHESAGEVVDIGSGVTTVQRGDRVALEPGVPCQTCDYCRGGRYNLCAFMQFAATPPYDGTLSTYYTLPEDFCFILPPHISIEEGALVEPLSIAVHSVKLAGVTTGQSILVFGAGPIGLLCCAVAKALGASTVLLVDIEQSRLTFAHRYAATGTYRMEDKSLEENAVSIMANFRLSEGADVVIDATGAESCISCGVHALRRGGTFVQTGLGASNIVFPVGQICSKEGTYKGSFRYGPGNYKMAIELLNSKKVSVKELITHTHEFFRAEEAFEGVSRRQGIKSIIYGPGVQNVFVASSDTPTGNSIAKI